MVNSCRATSGRAASRFPRTGTRVQDLGRRVAAGAAWMVALRFATRLLGVASMLVLARLLTPEDFGLVALATTIGALLDIASDFNFDLAIIRDRGAGRPEYDTAWTLQVLKGILLALLLLVLARPTASFFADPRLEPILCWLALAAFLQGIGNIGTVDFRRELEIAREFRFHLYGRLAQFATGLTLAFLWRDWRALVAAVMARRIVLLLASYTMAAYRPRLSLARVRELVGFSKWMLANNALSFVRERIDSLIVGKLAGPGPLGLYTIAQEIADLPTSELAQPVARAIYPGFARIAHEPRRLAEGYLETLALVLAICLPTAAGIALLAEPIVSVLLGARWLEAVPLIEALALYGAIRTVSTTTGPVFLALGRVRIEPLLLAVYLLLLVPLLLLLVSRQGVQGAAFALTVCAGLQLVLALVIASRLLGLRPARLLGATWRTVVATGVMAVAVLPITTAIDPPALRLLAGIAVGGTVFLVTHAALWWAAGRPAGAERTMLVQLGALIGRPSWPGLAGAPPS